MFCYLIIWYANALTGFQEIEIIKLCPAPWTLNRYKVGWPLIYSSIWMAFYIKLNVFKMSSIWKAMKAVCMYVKTVLIYPFLNNCSTRCCVLCACVKVSVTSKLWLSSNLDRHHQYKHTNMAWQRSNSLSVENISTLVTVSMARTSFCFSEALRVQ